ncbi:MAG TPA: hypothetical protein VJP58_09940 [Candidatus Nitrosocosmicus sp.]|nr:hypothetical protein [Candidatus Nitrosocosmicus sp.]
MAIFAISGDCDQIFGSTTLTIFTIPINIINNIIETNPIFENNLPLLLKSFKKQKHAIEKIITMVTAMVTKIDRLGNSEGEKEEMVSKIKKPPIIVALIIKRSFASMFIDDDNDVFAYLYNLLIP